MRDLFQVVFELKQKEIDDAYKKMDKDKRVMILHLSNHVYLHIHYTDTLTSIHTYFLSIQIFQSFQLL